MTLSRWLEQFNSLNKSYSYSINNIGLVKYSNIPFTGFLFIEKVIFLILVSNKNRFNDKNNQICWKVYFFFPELNLSLNQSRFFCNKNRWNISKKKKKKLDYHLSKTIMIVIKKRKQKKSIDQRGGKRISKVIFHIVFFPYLCPLRGREK